MATTTSAALSRCSEARINDFIKVSCNRWAVTYCGRSVTYSYGCTVCLMRSANPSGWHARLGARLGARGVSKNDELPRKAFCQLMIRLLSADDTPAAMTPSIAPARTGEAVCGCSPGGTGREVARRCFPRLWRRHTCVPRLHAVGSTDEKALIRMSHVAPVVARAA
eukprot:COSAG01_NODE_503_length_16167_cov_10.407230_11_plen_166_part_00